MSAFPKPPKAWFRWTPWVYDRLAKVYDFLSWVLFGINRKGHARVLEDLRPGRMLDVACGTARLLNAAGAGDERTCVGVDLSSGMLAQARKNAPKASLVQASYYALPFKCGSFDTVIETNALGNVETDVDKALAEMVRVCSVGGEIRLADYASSRRHTVWIRMVTWISNLAGDYPYNYKSILDDLGFRAESEPLSKDGLYRYYCAQKVIDPQ